VAKTGNGGMLTMPVLAILGDTTQIGTIISVLRHPKWPRQVSVACLQWLPWPPWVTQNKYDGSYLYCVTQGGQDW
jgi:hypothetical protein